MNDTVSGPTVETSSAGLSRRTPVHLWIVGILATLWNAFGCYDYVMTQTENAQYMEMVGFTAEQQAYFQSFPAWMEAFWALGVWGALLGSLLLLMRSRFAVHAYALSLLGLLVGTIYQYGMADMPDAMNTPAMMGMSAFIWIVAIALLVYAMRMRRNGVLR
jgi:hypothetical protein